MLLKDPEGSSERRAVLVHEQASSLLPLPSFPLTH